MIYLNIGSNSSNKQRDKINNILNCLKLLLFNNIKIKKISNYFETPSYPNKNFNKFVNISIEISYSNSIFLLHKKLLFIEKKMGRFRSQKNFPRIIDIDIIDFKGFVIKSKNLEIPHPRAHERNFVLYPLKEINKSWIHPSLKKNIDFFIKKLTTTSRIEITRVKKSDIKEL